MHTWHTNVFRSLLYISLSLWMVAISHDNESSHSTVVADFVFGLIFSARGHHDSTGAAGKSGAVVLGSDCVRASGWVSPVSLSESSSLSPGFSSLYAIFTALQWDTFHVRYLPSRYVVTIEPFLLTTLKACGSYLVENLLCFGWQTRTVSNWQTWWLGSPPYVSVVLHLGFGFLVCLSQLYLKLLVLLGEFCFILSCWIRAWLVPDQYILVVCGIVW